MRRETTLVAGKVGILTAIILLGLAAGSLAGESDGSQFVISFPPSVHEKAITGRVFLIISHRKTPEPRFQVRRAASPPFFGKDITNVKPDEEIVIDNHIPGFPLPFLSDIPAGDYYVQAVIHVYTQFHRADGHTVWLHEDHWEGQQWNRSPGNLYSEVLPVHLDPGLSTSVPIRCNQVVPPVKIPEDTPWIKRIKFQSKLLSHFWGRPIYLGATILLPKGYDQRKGIRYPVVYLQGHFSLRAPKGFRTQKPVENERWGQRGYRFYQTWISDSIPRMIYVTFQHPCPYFDDSYAVNSANCGPYGDAIMNELIPAVESRFRIIRKPYARILEGGSTGGWEALALQLFYPDFFGGALVYCPDPIDFRDVEGVHIYQDENAFYRKIGWRKVPIADSRRSDGSLILTSRQIQQYERVLGSKGRSGEQWDIWQAVFGPVGDDGYPTLLIDKKTGTIDRNVAQYWKEHYDLRYYLQQNWATLGAKIKDKLYFFTGDMDTYYLNNPVHFMEEFLSRTSNPHYPGYFVYAPRKTHCWTGPFQTEKERLLFIARQIRSHAPKNENFDWWRE